MFENTKIHLRILGIINFTTRSYLVALSHTMLSYKAKYFLKDIYQIKMHSYTFVIY